MASPSQPNHQRQTDDLLATQKLLRATLDSSMDMIQVFEAVRNEQGEIIDFIWLLNNHASEKIYGNVVGKSLLQRQPGVVEEGIFAAFKHVVETGQPQQYEKHYVHEQFDGWFFQSVVKLGDGVATTTVDITGRKNAEQALQQSKALLQDVIDAPNIGIAVYKALRNSQGQIIDFVHEYINRASMAMLGGEDFTGKLFTDHGENGIAQLTKLIDVIETGIGNSYLREAHFRGRQVWFAITNSPLDADRLVHTWEDVTQRQKAEQESKEQAHFIKSVTEMMPDVVSVVEFPSRTILYTNRDTLTWVGFDADELSNLSFDERIQLFHPDDLPTIQDFYGRFGSLKDRVETSVEYRLKNKQGEWTLLSLRGQVFRRDEQGQATQLLFVGQNITAQRQAEQEILRLKDELVQTTTDKYRSLFDSIDEGFAIVEVLADQRGRVTDMIYREANPAFERHSGMRDFVGKKVSDILPHLEPHWLDLLTGIYQTGEPTQTEQPIAELGRWLHVNYSRVGGAGSPLVAVVVNDITGRKRRETNLAFLAELSQELVRMSRPEETLTVLGSSIGAHFNSVRVSFVEIVADQNRAIVHEWHGPELSSVADEYPLSQFLGERYRQLSRTGQPIVIPDAYQSDLVDGSQLEAVFGVVSFINIPLVRDGQWVFTLGIHDTVPRQWRADEIDLLQELAARIWARLEKARAEEALQASQKRFESIANLVPDLLWDSGPDGSSNWYNQRWLAYTGQRFEEAIGWGWMEAIHPDDRDASARRSGEAVAAGQSLRQEHRIRRHDGVYRWFVVSTSPLKDVTGQVVKMYGAATDIHDRRLVEAALQESERRFRLAIEATELATWEWNLETNQVYWNEQHFRLFGMEPRTNPVSPDEFMRHVHPHEQARIKELLERAIAERGVYEAEFCAVLEDGSQRWMSGYGRITEERDGQPVRMSGVMFDVDERRWAEDALRLADRRKDEFLAMLAHELRNPMSTIRSGLQILMLTAGEDAMTASTVTMMDRQMDHLVRMVDDLLDVSRISRGKIELREDRVNLVDLVRQAVESVQAQFEQQGKGLQVSLPTAVIELQGDATRLTQVVTNLLTNGLRYTGEQGQVWLRLKHKAGISQPLQRTGGTADHSEAILEVRDNGIGLAEDQLTAIFELFVQVDNSLAHSKGGLGLGLTLVKRLVELHGGHVEAQSEGLGQGSTFTVHLPTLTVAEQPTKPNPMTTDTATTKRILVIDDNADAAFTLAMLLKLKGYETHTRNSGRAGIEAAESVQPAAILLDIGMPDLDGYATCRLLRQQPWGRDVVVIALTGYGQEEDKQRTKEAGFDGHLTKPVDMGALQALLTSLLPT